MEHIIVAALAGAFILGVADYFYPRPLVRALIALVVSAGFLYLLNDSTSAMLLVETLASSYLSLVLSAVIQTRLDNPTVTRNLQSRIPPL